VADKIRILIADDHPIVRKGLLMTIEEHSGLSVVAEAGDGETALAIIRKLAPHIAVLDFSMPKMDGFGVAREVARLKLSTKIIFLTLHDDEDLFRAAMDLGAKGYLLKDSAMEEIAAAVKVVAAGGTYVSSVLTVRLLEKQRQPESATTAAEAWAGPGAAQLTATERRILRLIAGGLSSKEIGSELSIHFRTVENHRTNICRKLGLEGANALVRFALQNKSTLE